MSDRTASELGVGTIGSLTGSQCDNKFTFLIFTSVFCRAKMGETSHITTKVEIHCRVCDNDAGHTVECPDKQNFPVSCVVRTTDEFIISVSMSDGTLFTNEERSVSRYWFSSQRLNTFSVGRQLKELSESYEWQKYTSTFEESLLQGGPVGLLHSTAKWHRDGTLNNTLSSISSHATPIQGSGSQQVLDMDILANMTTANASALTESLTKSTASNSLVGSIPIFNGDEKNFPTWLRKVEAARKYQTDDIYLDQVRQKLGTEPTEFIQGFGIKVDTVDGLLDELKKRYDLLSNPSYSFNAFRNCVQAGRGVDEYHTEFATYIRAIGETLDTANMYVCTGYILGLDETSLRESLNFKMAKNTENNKETTLRSLMQHTTTKARVKIISSHSRVEERDNNNLGGQKTPVMIAKATITQPETSKQLGDSGMHVSPPSSHPPTFHSVMVGEQDTRFGTPRSGKSSYCPIHEASTHDIEQCKMRYSTECKYCGTSVTPGQLQHHVPKCTGRRCNNCGRLGHIAKFCKFDAAGNFIGKNQGVPRDSQLQARQQSRYQQQRGGGDAEPRRFRSQDNRYTKDNYRKPAYSARGRGGTYSRGGGRFDRDQDSNKYGRNNRRSRSPQNRQRLLPHLGQNNSQQGSNQAASDKQKQGQN